jgi:large subunit ribosomal protein L9
MATTEVLLIKPIEDFGNEGDKIKVKSGYARNYLFPRKFAIPITRANKKQIEALQKAQEKRIQQESIVAKEQQEQLKSLSITIPVKTGPEGRLFGSVTTTDIHNILQENNIKIKRKKILLKTPVKALGKYKVTIKLHPDIASECEFEVVSKDNTEKNTPQT